MFYVGTIASKISQALVKKFPRTKSESIIRGWRAHVGVRRGPSQRRAEGMGAFDVLLILA